MSLDKGRAAQIGIAKLLYRCRWRGGRQLCESILAFSQAEIRPLYDGARLLEKWADRADDPKEVRFAVRILDAVVDRCKGPDGKVAATGWVYILADEAGEIDKALRAFGEYVGTILAAADRRSQKSDKKR